MLVLAKKAIIIQKILNLLSKKLDCSNDQILIMSTGIIGRQLPMKI